MPFKLIQEDRQERENEAAVYSIVCEWYWSKANRQGINFVYERKWLNCLCVPMNISVPTTTVPTGFFLNLFSHSLFILCCWSELSLLCITLCVHFNPDFSHLCQCTACRTPTFCFFLLLLVWELHKAVYLWKSLFLMSFFSQILLFSLLFLEDFLYFFSSERK